MMTFSSQYQIKKVFYVLTITVDKNYYFHPSSVISPLKDFTLYMYINTCSSSKVESTNILLRLFEARTKQDTLQWILLSQRSLNCFYLKAHLFNLHSFIDSESLCSKILHLDNPSTICFLHRKLLNLCTD